MSAGKTTNGTLDSWDCILLAAQEWEGRVDGFVRMEGGFEVVLCEFERGLDVVRITWARKEDGDGDEDGKEGRKEARERDTMQYYKAIAAGGWRWATSTSSQHIPTLSTSSAPPAPAPAAPAAAKWRWKR